MIPNIRASRRRLTADPTIIVVGLFVFALDQIAKAAVVARLGPDASKHTIEVLGSLLRLSYVTNSGAAFGLFTDKTIVFAIIGCIAVPFFVFSRGFLEVDHPFLRFVMGLLLGGTLGNLVDRIRIGYVVDYIDFGLGATRFYTFNVADCAFVVGIIILSAYLLFWPDQHPADESVQKSEAS